MNLNNKEELLHAREVMLGFPGSEHSAILEKLASYLERALDKPYNGLSDVSQQRLGSGPGLGL